MLYRFHDAEFDPQFYTLRRAGQIVPLRPKVFQVLLYLVQHRQRVVRKEELLEAVWSGHFVSEATLESTISALRRALGDSGRTQRLIQTFPGHGYYFAGTVQEVPEHAAPSASAILSQPAPLGPSASVPAALTPYDVLPDIAPPAAPLPVRSAPLVGEFIGRSQELHLFQERLQAVQSGYGMVIGIVGEAGIGKSRLLAEFRQTLTGHAVTYLQGRCLPEGKALPYLPVLALLRQHCGIGETDPATLVSDKLQHALQEVAMEPVTWMPYLRTLYGLPGDQDVVRTLSPQVVQLRLIDTLVQLGLRGSQRRPLLLEIEDLHWIDSASEAYLLALTERLARARVLVLLSYRPGYRSAWMNKSYAMQMALQRFTPQESVAVVRGILRTQTIAPPVLRDIVAKADGNPFFLEELALAMSQAEAGQSVPLPTTVQAVLAARMERLEAEEKRLLQLAAVIGKDTPWPLLQAVATQDAAALLVQLRSLQRAEFLYEQPTLPAPTYIFKHTLTQEVAYQTLAKHTRQDYHQRIAHVLETRFPDVVAEQPALLAHHYMAADLGSAALPYWQQAGQQAQARSAHVEACQHFTRGLEALADAPSTPHTMSQELALRMQHGTSLILTRGYAAPDVEQTFQRAQMLCRELGETPQMFSVHWGLWAFAGVRSDLPTSRYHAEQMLALAGQQSDLLVEAYMALGGACYWSGVWEQARHHLQRGLDVYDASRHRANRLLYGQDPGVACLGHLAQALWMLGYPEQARQHAAAGIALARSQSHPYSLAYALIFAATCHLMRREPMVTQSLAEEAIALCTEHGFAIWLADGDILRGWALTQQGQGEAGLQQLHDGVAGYAATGATLWRTQHLAILAEAYASLGHLAEARQVLQEAQATMQRLHEEYYAAELWRLEGEFLLQDNTSATSLAQAARLFQQAGNFARRQGGTALQLRAAMSLARLRHTQDQEAEAALAEVYALFTEGFDTPDLQEAQALLRTLRRATP